MTAVVEVVLGVAVAAEAGEVESAAVLDSDLQQQRVFATDSSSEPGAAAAVFEAGHSEEHSGAKPGTRRVALPCAGPWPVAASEALQEPEDPEDAASAAAAVGHVAVPEQLGRLASVASVESASCAEEGDSPFALAGRRDSPASGRIAAGSCLDDRSCPSPYPCRSSAAAVAVAAVVAAVAELVALPSSVAGGPCVAVAASSIGGYWPLRRVVLASDRRQLAVKRKTYLLVASAGDVVASCGFEG